MDCQQLNLTFIFADLFNDLKLILAIFIKIFKINQSKIILFLKNILRFNV
jgi:hypothetical protein